MAECILLKGGSGLDTDELTATPEDVLKGKTAGVKGSDEPVPGTLELTGNADETHVLAGKDFYTTNPKVKQKGEMPNIGAIDTAVSAVMSAGSLYVRMNPGAHISKASSGYPEVSILPGVLASAIGLTADKLWPGNTVLGIASNKASMAGGTYTPKAAQQTISCSGKAMTSNIIIAGDGDLVAGNIVSGKNIFGVNGNARKYGIKKQFAVTSETGTLPFYREYNGSTKTEYLRYITVNIDFTPTCIIAFHNEMSSYDVVFYDGWNFVLFGTSKANEAYFYSPSKNESIQFGKKIVLPVTYASTSYNVVVGGYY